MASPAFSIHCTPETGLRSLARAVVVLLLVCLVTVPGARAGSIEDAQLVLAEGKFEEAVRIAETLDTSEGQALAARALTTSRPV